MFWYHINIQRLYTMKYRTIFSALLLGGILASCMHEPVVLEFNDSYTPKKPTPGKLDPLPPVDVYNTYVFPLETNVERTVVNELNSDGAIAQTTFDATPVELRIRTSIAAKEDLVITPTVITAENNPEAYASLIKGTTKLLPENAYTIAEANVTIPQGEKETVVHLNLNEEVVKGLDFSEGSYLLPVMLQLPEGKGIVRGHFMLTINSVTRKAFPTGNNVELVSTYPQDIQDMIWKSALSFKSNVVSGRLNKLNDGVINDSWYTRESDNAWLTIHFSEANIRMIELYTNNPNSFSHIKVEVSTDGGNNWIPQGAIDTTQKLDQTNIAFTQPVTINAIRLSEFIPLIKQQNNQYGDITEIRLFTAAVE